MRTNTPAELDRSVETIVAAFEDDPLLRWIFPDVDDYRRHFPVIARLHGARAQSSGTAYHNEFGAAFWFPPQVEPDTTALMRVLDGALAPERREVVLSLLGEMQAVHVPQPHWYLRLIGVSPGHQGGGVGANLALRSRLDATAARQGAKVFYPRIEFCTDNAAMIAVAGLARLKAGTQETAAIRARANWSLAELGPLEETSIHGA